MEAEGGDVACLREGETDLADTPDRREEGNLGVEAGEDAGAAEGARGGAGVVEHCVDLLGGWGVRGGDDAGAKLGDAEDAPGRDDVRGGAGRQAYGDGEDVVAGV